LVFGEKAESMSFHDLKENIEEAIESLDRRDRLEKTVLQTLKKHPRDYSSAFASISKGTRFIYVHAY
jgi:tRNA(Glu) U13 pseudouridine synthase TruD